MKIQNRKLVILTLFICFIGVLGVKSSKVSAEETIKEFGDYEYIELDNTTVEITNYIGSNVDVQIPQMIDGKSVVSIGVRAFDWREDIISVTIPEGVKNIRADAFEWCTNLKNVTIPKSVTSIGENAFEYCRSLSNVTIPDGIKKLKKELLKDVVAYRILAFRRV